PPTSWWRFVAWLLIGFSVYLSYSYSNSEIGRKIGRAHITAPWLILMAIGSFLVAVGLLTIPHDASLGEMMAQMGGRFADARQTFIGLGCIGIGLVFSVAGSIIGLAQQRPTR